MEPMDEAPEGPEVELNKIATEWCMTKVTLTEWQVNAFVRIRKKRFTVVSVPTGSGKSMVFSLLPKVLGKCVFVIIPLLSLITDNYQRFS